MLLNLCRHLVPPGGTTLVTRTGTEVVGEVLGRVELEGPVANGPVGTQAGADSEPLPVEVGTASTRLRVDQVALSLRDVALARVFDLPVLYFFLPPENGERGFDAPDSPAKGWPWEYLLMLVWGHARNFGAVAERAAPWAHASAVVTMPAADVLDGAPDDALLARLGRDRERYTPEDMLAVAFNGLARRHMRGSMRPGEEVSSLAASLRGLADALEVFGNYRPGTFLDLDEVRERGEHQETDE